MLEIADEKRVTMMITVVQMACMTPFSYIKDFGLEHLHLTISPFYITTFKDCQSCCIAI